MMCTEIDGSVLEGGGQILRIALTLSVIRRIPVRIKNIRAGRRKSGLLEQHLKGVELLQAMSDAQVTGANIGSTDIEFNPQTLKGGVYEATIRTAGSVSLLLQVALPCALLAENATTLILRGGTNTEMAPQIEYTTEVFRPNLQKFGATFDFELIRRGYFPKGGGEVQIDIEPVKFLKPVQLTDTGKIKSIHGWSFVAGSLPIKIAKKMADSVKSTLEPLSNDINIEVYKEDRSIASDNCFGIILVAETDTGCFLGGDALGNRKEWAENTGKRAAQLIMKSVEENACFDSHAQDQMIVLMALAKGVSKIRVGKITMHTKTAIFVTERLTDAKFEVIPDEDSFVITCTGESVFN